jgi:DNA invertase Pin-like site-specific DNA recombinase
LQLDALKAAGCGKIFVEKASGAQRDRPELLAALDYMRPGDTLHAARRYACDLEA